MVKRDVADAMSLFFVWGVVGMIFFCNFAV